ncbi:MAG: proton-conducting transporter membrane subunit [Candidatus Celaenobacter antarcticus]|nr:proton-conducting transporter membrane subunit [Candidatus Celaenobacter antarcticus]
MVNPVLLIVVPLVLAFALPLVGLISKKNIKYIPVLAFLFNFVISLLLIPKVLHQAIIVKIGGFLPPFGINLFVGPVGILFSTLIALAGLLVSIYALSYIKEGSKEKYHILYLLLLTGATGVVLTGDMFNLFVFFEILCISSYALVAYLGNKAGIESSIKYLIQGSVGSSLLLLGIGLLYGQLGTLNMADIANQIHSSSSPSIFVPMVLMITGLGVEAAIFPLNAWLPDAHSSAPSSISAILSGIAIEVGLYAVIRIIFTIFNASSFLMFFIFLGVLTLLIGEMSAFSQKNIKRMLAYSSIGQIGLIMFAVSLNTQYGVSAGLFQMISHTLGKGLLFLAAGYMIYRSGSMDISSFEGIGKKMPYTSLAFTIGTFSIIGLPPFIGFASKFMVIKAALAKEGIIFTVLIGLALIGTIIESAYFFRVVQVIYFKKGNGNQVRKEAPITGLIPMFIFALLIIFIGVYPNFIIKILNSAASELLNRIDYIRSVLG